MQSCQATLRRLGRQELHGRNANLSRLPFLCTKRENRIHTPFRGMSTHPQPGQHSHYETLGVHPTASRQEIKKKFYELSMKYHPDRNQGNEEAHSRFIKFNEAYDVLRDDRKRRDHDRVLRLRHHHHYQQPGRNQTGSHSSRPPQYYSRQTRSSPQYQRNRSASWAYQQGYARPTGETTGAQESGSSQSHAWTTASRARRWNQNQSFTEAQTKSAHHSDHKNIYRGLHDLPPSDFDIYIERVSSVVSTLSLTGGSLLVALYMAYFYDTHMKTEPSQKFDATEFADK
ncbi:hypothetical protein IWQ62_005354 [Dispira parvispora]|uniref:J domain-containing protein n=1 Tax=Dispira parvispora TaxID=1520584 RepID=A0A9W8AR60_9FUNG|nr:hypothetical protein IWQ62_005354 [Dispira parvispora]